MRALFCAAAAVLLPSTSTALWCYHTTCVDPTDDLPCVTADAAVTQLRDCGARGLNALPDLDGGRLYDRCIRTVASGAVDYSTPADGGIGYYAWCVRLAPQHPFISHCSDGITPRVCSTVVAVVDTPATVKSRSGTVLECSLVNLESRTRRTPTRPL